VDLRKLSHAHARLPLVRKFWANLVNEAELTARRVAVGFVAMMGIFESAKDKIMMGRTHALWS